MSSYFIYDFLYKPLTNSIKKYKNKYAMKKIVSGKSLVFSLSVTVPGLYYTFGLLQKLKLKCIFYCIIATKTNGKNNNCFQTGFLNAPPICRRSGKQNISKLTPLVEPVLQWRDAEINRAKF